MNTDHVEEANQELVKTPDISGQAELSPRPAPSGQPRFTPGPWRLVEGLNADGTGLVLKVQTVEDEPWTICDVADCCDENDLPDGEEDLANGALIAAAPALYKTLKWAHACATLRDDGTCDGCPVSNTLSLATVYIVERDAETQPEG